MVDFTDEMSSVRDGDGVLGRLEKGIVVRSRIVQDTCKIRWEGLLRLKEPEIHDIGGNWLTAFRRNDRLLNSLRWSELRGQTKSRICPSYSVHLPNLSLPNPANENGDTLLEVGEYSIGITAFIQKTRLFHRGVIRTGFMPTD